MSKSDFGFLPVNVRAGDVKTKDITFTNITIGDDLFVWPTDVPAASEILTVDSYAANVATLAWSANVPAAAGTDEQVQYNDAGVISGDAGFLYDTSAKTSSAYEVQILNLRTTTILSTNTGVAPLTLTVPDQTVTNDPGAPILLTAGAGDGTGLNGSIQFASSMETINKTAVTQDTSATTLVLAPNSTGTITTFGLVNGVGVTTTFQVDFDQCAASSIVSLTLHGYAGTGYPSLSVTNLQVGSFDISVQNRHPSAILNAVVVIDYHVII
jgi:hypothetical protein